MKKLFVLFLLFYPIGSLAKDANHCNALLEHGITNITKKMSSDATIVYKWYKNCGTDIYKANDNVVWESEANIFGYFSGTGNSNVNEARERIKSWCETNQNFAYDKRDLYEEARELNESALLAWNQCQELADEKVKIGVTIQGEFEENVLFTIDSDSPGTHQFYGVTTQSYSCQIFTEKGELVDESDIQKINLAPDKNLFKLSVGIPINNKNIHITCSRDEPSRDEENGIGQVRYNPGNITVMTNGPALSVSMSKIVQDYYVTPPGAVVAINSDHCPEGWIDYKPAYGRFIRGIDKDGQSDPDGSRKPGTLQEDSFKSHDHGIKTGYQFGTKPANWGLGHYNPTEGPEKGHVKEEGGKETRPKNVALLYCIKE